MSTALGPPFLVASLIMCVAGVAKFHAPAGAAWALQAPTWVIRALAIGEVALGVACVVHPTQGLAVALALVYGLFSAVAVFLMRRGVPCGCFGDNDLPVSRAHVIASELLCALAVGAALSGPRGLAWVLRQPAPQAAVLIGGIAGAAYAVVLVYTELPAAWTAWSGE